MGWLIARVEDCGVIFCRPCDPSRPHPLTSKGRFLFLPDSRGAPHRLCLPSSICSPAVCGF